MLGVVIIGRKEVEDDNAVVVWTADYLELIKLQPEYSAFVFLGGRMGYKI